MLALTPSRRTHFAGLQEILIYLNVDDYLQVLNLESVIYGYIKYQFLPLFCHRGHYFLVKSHLSTNSSFDP